MSERLHLVVQLSDGRQMLATCAPTEAVAALTAQLEAEIGQTFRAPLPLRYLGKVVEPAEGATPPAAPSADGPGAEALPPHFALSAAARAGDLLRDGDTVLAVAAEPEPEPESDGGDGPEPALGTVSACAARWDELERRKEKGRRHLAAELASAVPKEPRAAVSEEGRRLLGGLVETGEAVLCEAAVSALAAAAAIPQLAGLQATAVLRDAETISRGAADDKAKPQAVPSVAALLLDLCRATDPSVRSSAEGVLRHLQAEARAERARTDPAYTRRQAEPRAAAEVRGSRVGARGEEHVPAERDGEAPAAAAAEHGGSPGSAATPAALLHRLSTAGSGSAGLAQAAAALRALALQALKEESWWALLRTNGLVPTLIDIAAGEAEPKKGRGKGVQVGAQTPQLGARAQSPACIPAS